MWWRGEVREALGLVGWLQLVSYPVAPPTIGEKEHLKAFDQNLVAKCACAPRVNYGLYTYMCSSIVNELLRHVEFASM